jgi:uncharacterized membrane protein
MNCVVNPPTLETETLHRSWAIAARTAGVSAVLVATAGTALYRFLGVSASVLLAGAAVSGVLVGLKLPVAAPRPER